jgi:hypothetical protein
MIYSSRGRDNDADRLFSRGVWRALRLQVRETETRRVVTIVVHTDVDGSLLVDNMPTKTERVLPYARPGASVIIGRRFTTADVFVNRAGVPIWKGS